MKRSTWLRNAHRDNIIKLKKANAAAKDKIANLGHERVWNKVFAQIGRYEKERLVKKDT